MLWAALLLTSLGRKPALALFRNAVRVVKDSWKAEAPEIPCLTVSGIAALPDEQAARVVGTLTQSQDAEAALRPLLLLEELPGKGRWMEVLGSKTDVADWNLLARAVAAILNHQSEEATDCRWINVVLMMVLGRFKWPEKHREVAEEILQYPDAGDLRKVRPTIRSAEGALHALWEGSADWNNQFWTQCLQDTPCSPLGLERPRQIAVGTSIQRLQEVRDALLVHCAQSRATTAIDERHDGVFGIAHYGLALLEDLLRLGASTSVVGRAGLRSLLEALITLKLLVKRDQHDLWKAYRSYGAGQAKLAFLKLDQLEKPPMSVSLQDLQLLANEDLWQEFVPIDLGHWKSSNLRQMSIDADAKDEYDRYYDWTSGYVHGHWAAARNTVFDICANPLHRLHRVPLRKPRTLEDVVPDATTLADKILELVDLAYPPFKERLAIPVPSS